MRALLDESLPRRLAGVIPDHEVRTVVQMGWASVENGELLRLAVDAGFEAFVTADRNVEYQQNIARIEIGLVVLTGRSNRREHMMPLAPHASPRHARHTLAVGRGRARGVGEAPGSA